MFVVYSFGSLFTPVSVLTSIFSLIALDKVVHVLLSSWTFHIWCWKSNFADIWKLISSDITDWRDSSRQLDARLTFYFLQLLLVFRYHLLGFWNIYSMFWFSEICPLSLINSFPWYLPLIFSLWFPLLDFLCSLSFAWYPLLDFLCLISFGWYLASLPASIPLPLPETISSAADIADKLQLCPTYKLVFAPNLAISPTEKGDDRHDHQFTLRGANKKR